MARGPKGGRQVDANATVGVARDLRSSERMHRGEGRITAIVIAVLQIGLVAGILYWWWRGTSTGVLAPYVFGTPERVYRYLSENFGPMWVDLGITVLALSLGCLGGVVVGVAIGIASGLVRRVAEVIDPFVVAFNAMPRKIFIPLFVILFGLGVVARIWHVAFVVMFPIAISVAQAIRVVEGDLVANYVALGARRVDLLRHVYLPGISAWLVSSIRFTVGLGFQAVVLAEIVTGTSGLGAQIFNNQTMSNVSGVWAVLLFLLLFSVILDQLLRMVEKRTHTWKAGL
jgi:NitT/TauT family transport system permease protein